MQTMISSNGHDFASKCSWFNERSNGSIKWVHFKPRLWPRPDLAVSSFRSTCSQQVVFPRRIHRIQSPRLETFEFAWETLEAYTDAEKFSTKRFGQAREPLQKEPPRLSFWENRETFSSRLCASVQRPWWLEDENYFESIFWTKLSILMFSFKQIESF